MLRKLFGLGKKDDHREAPVADDWNRADKPPAPDAGVECSITFEPSGRRCVVKSGTTILEAALAHGVDLNNYCGGMCSCGSCRVVFVSGDVSPKDDMEDATLSVVQEGDDDRLGCQTRILGQVVVQVPDQDF